MDTASRIYSLHEIATTISQVITANFRQSYWIKTEMLRLNHYQRSGHCYPDLVEKQGGKVVAEMRANLWRSDYERINRQFLNVLHEPLKDDIKILLLATVAYHPRYGLSLRILDIDAGFTLGDMEQEKQETIRWLKEQGIYEENKRKILPLLPQRIAVISVETSKGYADFMNVMEEAQRTWHYAFFTMLFPSLLQGEGAVGTLIEQLGRIRKVVHHFDLVVIIRGGGGDVGLSCYNDARLATEIARFPIPVITGIGHSTNETVSEMVSHTNCITPTKLAELIIQKFHNVAVPVREAQQVMIRKTSALLEQQQALLRSELRLFRSRTIDLIKEHRRDLSDTTVAISATSRDILEDTPQVLRQQVDILARQVEKHKTREEAMLGQQIVRLRASTGAQMARQQYRLEATQQNLENMRPERILQRGFSITTYKGKHVKPGELKAGDEIETQLYQGTITSTVKKIT